MGDCNTIYIEWTDHNNVRQNTAMEVNVLPDDKPRTLEIKVNGVVLATVPPAGRP
jgi:hypothetical protein